MKIIDLLNKIANGEEVPKKIKLRTFELIRTDDYEARHLYIDKDGMFFPLNYTYKLDDEIEILDNLEEEKKIPEKLEILNANEHSKEVYYENYSKEEISLDIETLQIWINKIINYLDYLKSKGE